MDVQLSAVWEVVVDDQGDLKDGPTGRSETMNNGKKWKGGKGSEAFTVVVEVVAEVEEWEGAGEVGGQGTGWMWGRG